MQLRQILDQIAITKKIGGKAGAELSVATRAVIDNNNDIVVDPDFNVTAIPGATIGSSAAIIFTDIVTGKKYAMLIKEGAPIFVQQ